MRLTVSVTGARRTSIRFKELELKGRDWRPVLHAIADDFLEVERNRFRTGSGWAPLTRRYRAEKRRRGFPTKKLVRTGALRDSLTSRSHPNAVRDMGRYEVELGTSLYYARFHTRKRPPVKITPAVRRRWRAIVEDHVRP